MCIAGGTMPTLAVLLFHFPYRGKGLVCVGESDAVCVVAQQCLFLFPMVIAPKFTCIGRGD